MTEETENKQSTEQPNEQTESKQEKTIEKPAEKEDVPKEAKPLATEETKPKQGEDNTIFIGIKPFMNYVTGVVIQFQQKEQNEVIVSARGKFISKAVDVVEVARRTFLKAENIQVKDIKIASESFENKEGRRIHVSTIEIRLSK